MSSPSSPPPSADSGDSPPALAADSLAAGVLALLILNVVQRLVGFGRNLLFCGLMEDSQLGRWSLAFSFLTLAAPLAVLGLPGSFGRYVEHYRSRGQLRFFLVRATLLSAVGCAVLCLALWCLPGPFGWLIFRDSADTETVRLLAVALLLVVAWNFVAELFVALRQVKLVNALHVVSSFAFAGIGTMLLVFNWGERGVVIAYTVSIGVPLVIGFWWLRRTAAWQAPTAEPPSHRAMWKRILPYAGWLWLMNLACNLFEAVDRFMIMHLAPVSRTAADALVGQYHAGRVIPMLMWAVAGAFAGMLLPYLCHDWERGRRDLVARRLNLSLKVVALLLSFGGVILLLAGPLIFDVLLRGRYNQGLSILPWTITYCIWFALSTLAYTHLECAEKTRWGVLAILIGLAANVALNGVLVPAFGLRGAVWATSCGNALALTAMYLALWRTGHAFDPRVCLATALPVLVGVGLWPAAVGFSLLLVGELWRPLLLSAEERGVLDEVLLNTGKRWLPRNAPAPAG